MGEMMAARSADRMVLKKAAKLGVILVEMMDAMSVAWWVYYLVVPKDETMVASLVYLSVALKDESSVV